MHPPDDIPPPSGLATVHPSESSVDFSPKPLDADRLRDVLLHPRPSAFGVHESDRTRILCRLVEAGTADADKAASTMRDCLAYPAIYIDEAGALHPVLGRCKHRLCPLCSSARSAAVSARVLETVREWDSIRHIVLTLRHTDEDLSRRLDELISAYRRLRQSLVWRQTTRAAIATIEVTRNPNTGQWHPHLHVLATGDYIPHTRLREAWTNATSGSTIVNISRIDSRTAAAKYIGKYVAKPAQLSDWDAPTLAEYLAATKGRRLLIATGQAHNARLAPRKPDDAPKLVRQVASWHAIRRCYLARRPYAIALVERTRQAWPLITGHITYECPDPPPPLPADDPLMSEELARLLDWCVRWDDSGRDPPTWHAPSHADQTARLWAEAEEPTSSAFTH